MTLFLLACLVAVVSIGYQVWARFRDTNEPPKTLTVAPVPVQIEGKTVMLLIGVAGWQIPPEMNAALVQAELIRREAEEKAKQRAAAETNAAPKP
jgi:hypothetical protein